MCAVILLNLAVTCMFYVLHADKAKGLQINLSEALQGKHFQLYFSDMSANISGYCCLKSLLCISLTPLHTLVRTTDS